MKILGNVRWKVFDPLGNEIYLTEESFQTHIIKDHEDADSTVRTKLEEQVKLLLQNPCLVIKVQDDSGRRIYLDWGFIARKDIIYIRPLLVVTEAYGKVVTWFAKRSVNINVPKDGGIIYDRRISYLQIRQKI